MGDRRDCDHTGDQNHRPRRMGLAHAEQNAVISAARRDMIGATLYLAGKEWYGEIEGWVDMDGGDVHPCLICRRMIQNAGIVRVVSGNDHNQFFE